MEELQEVSWEVALEHAVAGLASAASSYEFASRLRTVELCSFNLIFFMLLRGSDENRPAWAAACVQLVQTDPVVGFPPWQNVLTKRTNGHAPRLGPGGGVPALDPQEGGGKVLPLEEQATRHAGTTLRTLLVRVKKVWSVAAHSRAADTMFYLQRSLS